MEPQWTQSKLLFVFKMRSNLINLYWFLETISKKEKKYTFIHIAIVSSYASGQKSWSDYSEQVAPVVNFIQWNIAQKERSMTLEPMNTRNLQTKLLENYNIAPTLQSNKGRVP